MRKFTYLLFSLLLTNCVSTVYTFEKDFQVVQPLKDLPVTEKSVVLRKHTINAVQSEEVTSFNDVIKFSKVFKEVKAYGGQEADFIIEVIDNVEENPFASLASIPSLFINALSLGLIPAPYYIKYRHVITVGIRQKHSGKKQRNHKIYTLVYNTKVYGGFVRLFAPKANGRNRLIFNRNGILSLLSKSAEESGKFKNVTIDNILKYMYMRYIFSVANADGLFIESSQ